MEKEEEMKEKLLQKNSPSPSASSESVRRRAWKESKTLWVVAGPAIITRFSTYGITVVTQSFIGHIGSTQLAAYALVFTLLLKFANGMASALETLCGQAYGAKKYEMLGIYLQRSWIILFTTSLFLLPIFIFTTPLLELLGQEKAIAEMAGSISLWSIGVVFAFIVSFTCQIFLQAQSKNKIIAYLAAVSMSTHVLLSWLLTVRYKLGIKGAMTSTVLAYWIPNFGQLVYIMRCCPETWKGFSFLAFKDLWPVVKISLSSGAMMCLEIWYNAVLIVLTGNLKNAEVYLDALSICLNINGWEMMIALGFFAAAGYCEVANELGRGSSEGAKFSTVVAVVTSFCIGVVLFFVFLLLRERIAYVFTSNPMVAEAVGELSPLLSFSILLNSVQPVLSDQKLAQEKFQIKIKIVPCGGGLVGVANCSASDKLHQGFESHRLK
ncbi:Protein DETOXIFICATION 21 [Stylosanthes scabra]|uniref:Protein DETOXIFICATION 21 n=1 Tax=Stylosanthes scabra TaxID=79078 RepID=A0ABU6Q9Q7_9FABA|nr:Protein DETOXIFICATION 21 [Stylosanthes scabra]